MRGDEYYPQPHLYCQFADEGEPYEMRGYYLVSEGDTPGERIGREALLKLPKKGD